MKSILCALMFVASFCLDASDLELVVLWGKDLNRLVKEHDLEDHVSSGWIKLQVTGSRKYLTARMRKLKHRVIIGGGRVYEKEMATINARDFLDSDGIIKYSNSGDGVLLQLDGKQLSCVGDVAIDSSLQYAGIRDSIDSSPEKNGEGLFEYRLVSLPEFRTLQHFDEGLHGIDSCENRWIGYRNRTAISDGVALGIIMGSNQDEDVEIFTVPYPPGWTGEYYLTVTDLCLEKSTIIMAEYAVKRLFPKLHVWVYDINERRYVERRSISRFERCFPWVFWADPELAEFLRPYRRTRLGEPEMIPALEN